MSGEGDRSERGTPPEGMRARTAKVEAEPAASAPAPRKKTKPGAGIMTAGGMDMARAHAANIQPKSEIGSTSEDIPKVVITAETDPRRVKTGPRLIEGGQPDSARPPPMSEGEPSASPWAAAAAESVDRRALPSANIPVAPPPPSEPEKAKRGGGWMRLAVAAVLLLLVAGVVRRVRLSSQHDSVIPPRSNGVAVAPPLPDEEPTAAPPVARVAARPRDPVAPSEVEPTAATADPAADPSADPAVDPAASATVAARPRLAPPPPRATYKPLFELPQEKSKE